MRRFLLSAAVLAFVPGQLAAQDRLSWLDLLSPNRIVQQFVQFGILTLRTQMDVKYGDLSVDLMIGRVTLSDVKMWPLPPWDINGDCVVSIDRLTIRSGSLDQIDRLRFKTHVSGVTAPLACLPREGREVMGMAGLDTLDIPRLTMDFEYGVPASDGTARIFGVVENAAAIDLTAEFAYIWVDGRRDMEEPDPVVFLKNARLTVENRGAWEALKGQLPPPMTDPAGGTLYVEGAIGSIFADMNDNEPISDSQKAFIESVVATWSSFVANPDTLVLETALSSDTFLDFEAMERSPVETFNTLKPKLSLTSAAVSKLLSVDLLKQALGADAAAMSDDDKRIAGMALISGSGAPRNLQAGFDLLSPLASAGDADAALALSAALEDAAPEDAYRWALVAGRGNATGATARLDRLETNIGFARVLELQNEISSNDSHPVDALASIASVRAQAAMRLEGSGQARSYAIAAMWATLGKALGDAESGDILADIDEHVRLAGDGAQEAWAPSQKRAGELATEAWLGQDLPGRFNP